MNRGGVQLPANYNKIRIAAMQQAYAQQEAAKGHLAASITPAQAEQVYKTGTFQPKIKKNRRGTRKDRKGRKASRKATRKADRR
jgi:hypothetical protein